MVNPGGGGATIIRNKPGQKKTGSQIKVQTEVYLLQYGPKKTNTKLSFSEEITKQTK